MSSKNKPAKGKVTAAKAAKVVAAAKAVPVANPQPAVNAATKTKDWLLAAFRYKKAFFARHWKGTVVIALVTLVFFWPIVTRISSYSEGGDAMFNAWTIARDWHCILHQGCANYADGNIYFPNKDSMLYSETQLSTGLLTLPLYFINQNPLFAYNVWTIFSFFLAGWFMYLLAKRLSRGNELVSILAGLIFAYAPFRMAAVFHLQNLSIMLLPLAALLIIKYLDTALKRYLAGLFVTMALLAYASWYQIVFGIFALGILVAGMWVTRMLPWRKALLILGVMVLGAATVAPLAKEYTRFSKEQDAAFKISDQVLYSSSVTDYFIPHDGTLVGQLYYKLHPAAQHNAYNLDSFSYHGLVLYATGAGLVGVGGWRLYKWRKSKNKAHTDERQNYKYIAIFGVIALVGFVISLGPLLKFKGHFSYSSLADGTALVIPAPWLAVDEFLPQLEFIRAIGRASVLTLFALCCLLAFLPAYLRSSKLSGRARAIIMAAVVLLVIVELMPAHRVHMATGSYAYNLQIPAVYKYIKQHPQIDDIVILRSVDDYKGAPIPVMRAEDVLWAGYHNRNIFNGYSGYTPPSYFETLYDFVYLQADDIPKMQKLGLKYVIIDKQLSAPRPFLIDAAASLFPDKVYEDKRYVLYKIPQQ
ncbi:MAG TPA: hypothetical protein VLF62_04715 [Candidatus Saccharimonadales bacterium]|nr:hypothetical protein [Candidatus Saccharimonadales bacterium]